MEERFVDIVETRPELLAHHYTEARLIEQSIPYWQKAGQRASQHSAHVEAISHLTKGLELLKSLENAPERSQQELELQTTLGPALMSTKGYASKEVEKTYNRALELCQQIGKTHQLFPVLRGLWEFYEVQGNLLTARELGEQLLSLAQSLQDPPLLVVAHDVLADTLLWLGEFAPARVHSEQGLALYDKEEHRNLAFLYGGYDPGVACLCWAAWTLWYLGYPEQALQKSQEALTLAQGLSQPHSLAFALAWTGALHNFRREEQVAQERAELTMTLSREQHLAFYLAMGTIQHGWALAEQGHREEGIAQMRQGIDAHRATGAELVQPYFLALLAEGCGKVGKVKEGLTVLAEALDFVKKNGERFYESEIYRLKGKLTLLLSQENNNEAEKCFRQAIDIASYQSAKSLELRATASLSRLLKRQGRKDEAQQMLAQIYSWFTEGFDTKDLKESKALLEELS